MTSKVAPAFASDSSNPFLNAAPLSPFTATVPGLSGSDDVADDAVEGSYTYALVPNGPAVDADEVESPASAIEILIKWGTNILHVAHLTPPRSFFVGESDAKDETCDYFVAADKLGAARLPIVLQDRGGAARLVLARGATGRVCLPGERAMSVSEAMESSFAQPCVEVAGAKTIALSAGASATIEMGGLTFEIGAVNAGKKIAGAFGLSSQALAPQAMSFLFHAGLLAAAAFFMPKLAMADESTITDDQKYALQVALSTTAEREQDQSNDQTADNNRPDTQGGTGSRAMHEEGKAGSEVSRETNKRFGLEGPKDNQDVHISRADAVQMARDFGMVGILNAGMKEAKGPTAAWGRDDELGNDPMSANGNLWGPTIGDAGGMNGLGLSGIGEGGGGMYEGIGLGHINTIGHGAGVGDSDGFGPGHGHGTGQYMSAHKVGVPSVRLGVTTASGRLPAEVIQRIVRQNYGRFKLCYENGLRTQPNLAGRVSVRFIIGHDGSVTSSQNGGSDLPDSGVVSCVTKAFYGLSFPAPDGGIVTVSYPIAFSPAGS